MAKGPRPTPDDYAAAFNDLFGRREEAPDARDREDAGREARGARRREPGGRRVEPAAAEHQERPDLLAYLRSGQINHYLNEKAVEDAELGIAIDNFMFILELAGKKYVTLRDGQTLFDHAGFNHDHILRTLERIFREMDSRVEGRGNLEALVQADRATVEIIFYDLLSCRTNTAPAQINARLRRFKEVMQPYQLREVTRHRERILDIINELRAAPAAERAALITRIRGEIGQLPREATTFFADPELEVEERGGRGGRGAGAAGGAGRDPGPRPGAAPGRVDYRALERDPDLMEAIGFLTRLLGRVLSTRDQAITDQINRLTHSGLGTEFQVAGHEPAATRRPVSQMVAEVFHLQNDEVRLRAKIQQIYDQLNPNAEIQAFLTRR